MMFRCGSKFRFMFIIALLFLYFPPNIYAATSLNDYPQIKNLWDDGELGLALSQLKDVAKDKPKDDEIFELLKKVTFQKKKLDQWINKATLLQEQQKFKEAKEILDFAKAINPNYSPYNKLVDQIETSQNELNYPSRAIFDGQSLGTEWKPYNNDGKLATYGKFENSMLLIDVPERHGWARVGVESNDTIIDLTEINQTSSHLKFNLDPKNTTGFVIDIEGENIDKKSRSYNRLSIVYKSTDDKTAVLELHKDGALHTKLEMESVAPESLELVIQPNDFMYLHLPDGRYLQTTSVKYPTPTKGYKLKIYSQAKKYQSEAKMALKSIELRNIPFKKKKDHTVIFDGKHLEGIWRPYEAYKHFFAEFARFKNNALMVNVPEKNNLGEVGIESSDTIIDLTETNQSLEYHLKFKFDPQNTTGFAIDLDGGNLDKSHSYNRFQILYKTIDDQSAMLELHKDGALHTKLDMAGAPESLELVIHPNNVMYLHLPDGRYLQTTSIKYSMPTKGYKLKVYSKPKQRHLASKMSLKSIELRKLPFEKRFDVSNLGKQEKNIVLFDGKYLEERWIPYNEQYMDYFRQYATLNDNKLIIDVPENNKWGEAGILSPEPLVWLDRLGKDGEFKTTFIFDPDNTTGFSIVVGDLNYFWKSPSGKNANLTWSKVEGKDISKLRLKIDNKLILDENLSGVSPSNVVVTFKNEELGIEGDTFSKKTFPWPHIVTNRALHLFVFSHANEKNLPVKMALKKIILDRKMGRLNLSPKLADGVEPLPIKEIFGSAQKENWECYEGKEKDSLMHCVLNDSGCLIDIPKGIKSTDGFKSKSNMIVLDKRRISEATLKMIIQFNPAKTDNFDITLGHQNLYLEKVNNDMYTFRLGKHLSRNIEAEWLKKEWNGQINIYLSKNYIEAELDGNVAIQIPEKPSPSFPLHFSTAPRNDPKNHGARFELQKITTQWIAPEGMNKINRWNFVNDEDFDPDTFLNELREGK